MIPVMTQHLREILGSDPAPWEGLSGASVFVTGGTGFLGCNLLEAACYLVDELGLEFSLTVLTRDPGAFRAKAPHLANHRAVTLQRGDVNELATTWGAFTHVIHGATHSASVSGRMGNDATVAAASKANANILVFCQQVKPRRLLFLSSGAVYGPRHGPVVEVPDRAATAWTPYGLAKHVGELAFQAEARGSGLELAIARAFTFVGPWQGLESGYAVTDFIRAARKGEKIILKGPPDTTRSYLYAPEAACQLLQVLLTPGKEVVCNVGSSEAIKMQVLAEAVQEIFCPDAEIEVLPSTQPPSYYVPDMTQAESLGLRQRFDLRETLRRTREWLDAQAF